jgi:hypothetical protein
MSRDARVMCGLALVLVPTIVYGGLTLLGVLGVAGGFFGVAHLPGLRILIYLGAAIVIADTLTVGIGLLRAR